MTKNDLNSTSTNSFGRKYRLKSSNKIASLFKKGSYLRYGCIVARYQIFSQEKNGLQVGVSVPKSRFKNASSRNLIKRRMRESIRIQKSTIEQALIHKEDKSISLMLIYSKNTIFDFEKINTDIVTLIKQITL